MGEYLVFSVYKVHNNSLVNILNFEDKELAIKNLISWAEDDGYILNRDDLNHIENDLEYYNEEDDNIVTYGIWTLDTRPIFKVSIN